MKSPIAILLLVLLVGSAGVLIGRAMRPDPVAIPKPAGSIGPKAMAELEARNSAKLEAKPRYTFIGPDGKTRLIDYGVHKEGDSAPVSTREMLLEGILSDLRHHPKVTGINYGLSKEEIAVFLKSPGNIPPQVLATLPPK